MRVNIQKLSATAFKAAVEPFSQLKLIKEFISVQWEQNEGNCGVCGDAYNLRSPRPHEAGGEYGKGIISRRYAAGQVINCTLQHAAVKMFSRSLKYCRKLKWKLS